jgi:hypothetical protein
MIHYRVYKSTPLVHILSQIYPVCIFPSSFFNTQFILTSRVGVTSLLQGFPTKFYMHFRLPIEWYMPCISHHSQFNHSNNIWWRIKFMKSDICTVACYSSCNRPWRLIGLWDTVIVSIPDEVIGFFNWSNSSSRTMTLGSTQPLTEMSTRNILGTKGWPARKTDNLAAICEPIF